MMIEDRSHPIQIGAERITRYLLPSVDNASGDTDITSIVNEGDTDLARYGRSGSDKQLTRTRPTNRIAPANARRIKAV